MKKIVVAAGLLAVSSSFAQVQKVDLAKDLGRKKVVDLYQATGQKDKTLSPLSKLKDFEVHLKWDECVAHAPAVFNAQKELRGWVGLTWLHCLQQAQKKKVSFPTVEKALTAIYAHKNLFQEEPWADELAQNWVQLKIAFLEDQVQKKNQNAATGLEDLLSGFFKLNKDQRSMVYQLLGDLALLRVNYAEAQFLYEEAQDAKDSVYLQDKLDFLVKARGLDDVKPLPPAPPTELSSDELKIEERMRQSLKQNDAISALKDAVLILNQYPGSRVAKRLKDKPLEIYLSLSETLAKIKALDEMEEADGHRLLEWAQNLHRRADYSGAQSLAQKFLKANRSAVQATSALWILGRSSHFLGQYDRALEAYNNLMLYHAGSDEAAEATLRSALIYYRKKDFSTASALLEKLLLQKLDRYDLKARYWLVRSLEETNKDRAKELATELIEMYPFSYYGLRLRAESQNGVLTWPEYSEKAPKLQTELYLVGAQKKSWQRFKVLSEAGWVTEAQKELSGMPFLKDPTLKMFLAEKLAARQQYMPAIRLVGDAMEQNVSLRREQFVKIGYPTIYTALFKTESDRYGVHVHLLRGLTRQESAFNLQAVSSSNALGLMQMIPPTAQEVAKKLGLKIELPDDMFRPEVNIPMGSFYISQMLDQFQGNVPFALAAYNAGPSRMKSWIEGRAETSSLVSQASSAVRDEIWFDELPWNETSFYVKAILRNILLYSLVEEGKTTLKPVLWQDMLSKKAK